MELADKLIQLRKAKGWTQANAANIIDIQQSYLSKLENGHYVPSSDVVDKLCIAYQIKSSELLSVPNKQLKTYSFVSVLLITSIMLLAAGYLSLFFPQTYYTYKATPVQSVQSEEVMLNFHLTDEYQGEIFLQNISGIEYKFKLIAQRKISRKENRWLIALGIVSFVVSFSYLAFHYRNKKQLLR